MKNEWRCFLEKYAELFDERREEIKKILQNEKIKTVHTQIKVLISEVNNLLEKLNNHPIRRNLPVNPHTTIEIIASNLKKYIMEADLPLLNDLEVTEKWLANHYSFIDYELAKPIQGVVEMLILQQSINLPQPAEITVNPEDTTRLRM